MKTNVNIGAILVLVLLTQQRSSARLAQEVPYHTYGPAADSCGSWTAAPPVVVTSTSDSGRKVSYLLWVEGYVSGAGAVLAVREKIGMTPTDPDGIQGWITKYCTDHPLNHLEAAAAALVVELSALAERK